MRRAALLLGRQGAGKGTIGRIVQREGLLQFLSAGDVLRIESRAHTDLGRRIAAVLRGGDGIPTAESYPLIARAIHALPPGPVLLDGCPRRSEEVELVHELFSSEPGLVLELDVPSPIALDRLLARRTCRTCEAPYGPLVPTAKDGRCAACDGAVGRRDDDTIEALRRRLAVWDVESRRIMRYYSARTRVVRVDATRTPSLVAADVIHLVRVALLQESTA